MQAKTDDSRRLLGSLRGMRQSGAPQPDRPRAGDPREVFAETVEWSRNKGGKWPRRTALCGGAFLLAFFYIFAQAVFADVNLLRGPRKTVRPTVQAAEPASGKLGIGEEIAAAPVRFYQRFLGAHWGRRCAYHPSCSNYSLLAIRKHGAVIGLVMTFDRLQHESNEARYSPLIRTGGEIRVYDPLENNDYWWYTSVRSDPAAPAGAEINR